jgi:hypothetical protein
MAGRRRRGAWLAVAALVLAQAVLGVAGASPARAADELTVTVPPTAAPGDTVTVTATFVGTGDPPSPYATCSVAFAAETVTDCAPVSTGPYSVQGSFQVPADAPDAAATVSVTVVESCEFCEVTWTGSATLTVAVPVEPPSPPVTDVTETATTTATETSSSPETTSETTPPPAPTGTSPTRRPTSSAGTPASDGTTAPPTTTASTNGAAATGGTTTGAVVVQTRTAPVSQVLAAGGKLLLAVLVLVLTVAFASLGKAHRPRGSAWVGHHVRAAPGSGPPALPRLRERGPRPTRTIRVEPHVGRSSQRLEETVR